MEPLHLQRHEYTDVPDGVQVPVKTVIEKLPAPQRRKYRQLNWAEQMAAKERDLMEHGVDAVLLAEWLNNYVAPAQQGRQPSVVYPVLVQIQGLCTDYGVAQVNSALAANLNVGRAQEVCNIRYLKSILRNAVAAQTAAAASRPAAPATGTPEAPPWDRIRASLQRRLLPPDYNTWIRPCTCLSVSREGLVLAVPTEVHSAWLKDHYSRPLCDAFKDVYRRIPAHLRFEVRP